MLNQELQARGAQPSEIPQEVWERGSRRRARSRSEIYADIARAVVVAGFAQRLAAQEEVQQS